MESWKSDAVKNVLVVFRGVQYTRWTVPNQSRRGMQRLILSLSAAWTTLSSSWNFGSTRRFCPRMRWSGRHAASNTQCRATLLTTGGPIFHLTPQHRADNRHHHKVRLACFTTGPAQRYAKNLGYKSVEFDTRRRHPQYASSGKCRISK